LPSSVDCPNHNRKQHIGVYHSLHRTSSLTYFYQAQGSATSSAIVLADKVASRGARRAGRRFSTDRCTSPPRSALCATRYARFFGEHQPSSGICSGWCDDAPFERSSTAHFPCRWESGIACNGETGQERVGVMLLGSRVEEAIGE
jgi:hypothetical protein